MALHPTFALKTDRLPSILIRLYHVTRKNSPLTLKLPLGAPLPESRP